MDASELHYINYDAEATWDEMMRAYVEAGGDILYPGDEKEILQAIAADESCIIAGRSAFHVFRDHPNHLSILIQASMPHRFIGAFDK